MQENTDEIVVEAAHVIVDGTQERQEGARDVLFDSCLDGAGNSPVKLLALLALDRNPGDHVTASTVRRTIINQQGAIGELSQANVFTDLLKKSITPLGLAEKSSITSERTQAPVDAYMITDLGHELGVPIAGVILDWELRHPEFSAQRLLGSSNSTDQGTQRTPSARVNFYEYMLTHPTGKPGKVEIQRALGMTDSRTFRFLENLEDDGIIGSEYKIDISQRRYEIYADPDPEKLRFNPGTRAEIRALYGIAREWLDAGLTEITGSQIVEEVAKRVPEVSENPHEFWKAFTVARERTGFLREIADAKSSSMSRVELNPELIAAIQELIDALMSVKDGTASELYSARALEIFENPSDVEQLVKKAKKFSVSANAKAPTEWLGIITDVLQANPGDAPAGMPFSELHERVQRGGNKITSIALRNLITQALTQEGSAIRVETVKGSGKTRMPASYVRLESSEESDVGQPA